MGFGFRKSIKVAPGIRLSLGRRSAGMSVGPRGAKASVNTRRRRRMSLGLGGFWWRKKL